MSIRELFNQKNIIPTTLIIISVGIFLVPTNNDPLAFLIYAILSEILAGIAAAIWIFRMPKKKVSEIYNYLIVGIPSVLAIGILCIFYSFGFDKQQPLFVTDMWFVVLATLGAILAMFFSEKRIKGLELKTDGLEQKIDDLEQKLNDMKFDRDSKTSTQNTRIDILSDIALTRFELEKTKAELHKPGLKNNEN